MISACGAETADTGAHTRAPGKTVSARKTGKKAVLSDGIRDFDAGLRALKLGGPEANREAAQRFERAAALDGSLWEAWFDLGVTRVRLGDDRGAVAAFSRVLEKNPGYAPARLGRAEASRRMRHYSDAKDDYAVLLKADEKDNVTRLRLASLLRESGDVDGSLKTVREVLRRSPSVKDTAAANVELGLDYLAAGRDELAELVLSKAAAADAKNPAVWNALALVALRQGKDQEAFDRLDHATSLDPNFRDARFNKAAVLLDAGDYAQAKTELDTVMRGMPEENPDIDALVALGVAQRGLGQHDQARNTWEKALRTAPMHADALWNLAVLEQDFLKDETKAREYLQRYLDAASDDHPRRKDATSRMAELGPAPAPASAPAVVPGPKTPTNVKKEKGRK